MAGILPAVDAELRFIMRIPEGADPDDRGAYSSLSPEFQRIHGFCTASW